MSDWSVGLTSVCGGHFRDATREVGGIVLWVVGDGLNVD